MKKGDRVKLQDGQKGIIDELFDDGQAKVKLDSGKIVEVAQDALTIIKILGAIWKGVKTIFCKN